MNINTQNQRLAIRQSMPNTCPMRNKARMRSYLAKQTHFFSAASVAKMQNKPNLKRLPW
jgi:hypothetical protein